MKLPFLFACALALANAGYLEPDYQTNSISQTQYIPQNYYQPGNTYTTAVYKNEHVPVIKNGVPVDTPEVQQARAEHFALYAKAAAAAEAAKATAAVQKQLSGHNDDGSYHQSPQAYYPSTPSQGTSYIYQSVGHLSNSGAYAHQQAGPVDSVDVQQAKAAHFAALQRAAIPEHHRYRRGIVGYGLEQLQEHVPLITKDGVPLETPEVQIAKAQHLLAHANAKAGHQEWNQDAGNYGSNYATWTNYGSPEVNKVQYAVNHNYGGSHQSYVGPQHYPVIDKDGVPIETPEVQFAKQQHLLAHSQAKLGLHGHVSAGSYYGSGYPHASLTPEGVPEDTPEVQIAKAQHFAAHAEERAKHSKWAGQEYNTGYAYEAVSHY